MRNLLVLAIALSVTMTDEDVINLGYDASEAEFKAYFGIPEETVVDMENMKSEYKHNEDFAFASVKRFMDGKEQTAYKKAFPAEFAKTPKVDAKTPATSKEEKASPVAKDTPKVETEEEKAKKVAEKEAADKAKADEKAKKDAEKKATKEAADKAKADAKAVKDKAKADAKAAKDAEKLAKDAEKNAPKPISRSQEIFILHSEGKTLEEITTANPEWNKAHVRNALFTAKAEQDKVDKAIAQKEAYDAYLATPKVETPEATTVEEVPQATATEETGTTEESI